MPTTIGNWQWIEMGKPQGVGIAASMGAVTVIDGASASQRPHVFMRGTDGNLWCHYLDARPGVAARQWRWLNLEKPPVNIVASMGTVSVRDEPNSGMPGRPHVFVLGDDSNLWCRSSTGVAWQPWLELGKPSTTNIVEFMGAVTVQDSPAWGSPEQPHVFVRGQDSNIWCCWYNTKTWQWKNLEKPPGTYINACMGVVTIMNTPMAPQRAHVFVQGNDHNIWCRYWDGKAWQWANLSKPSNVNIIAFRGLVAVKDTPDSVQRAHLFVEGDDANIWCLWCTGTSWHWTNMETPSGVNLRASMGAVVVQAKPTSAELAHLFVEGDDGNIWCRWSDGKAWHWTGLGQPSGVGEFMGAVSMRDTSATGQRGHTFMRGTDGNFWCLYSNAV